MSDDTRLFSIHLGNQYDRIGCTLARVRLEDISQAYSICKDAQKRIGEFWMRFGQTDMKDRNHVFEPINLPSAVLELYDNLRPYSIYQGTHYTKPEPGKYNWQPSRYGTDFGHPRSGVKHIPIDMIFIVLDDRNVATINLF